MRRQLETNLFGVLRTFYAARTSLVDRRGMLVMIGSVSGFVSLPGTVAYSVSKFGVRALAEGLTLTAPTPWPLSRATLSRS